MNRKHGMHGTPTHSTWRSMMRRCHGSSDQAKRYRDRGISVCDRWHDFNEFLRDMGIRPDGATLDRVDLETTIQKIADGPPASNSPETKATTGRSCTRVKKSVSLILPRSSAYGLKRYEVGSRRAGLMAKYTAQKTFAIT